MPSKRSDTGKWQGRIWHKGKVIYCGSHKLKKDAVAAEEAEKLKLGSLPKNQETTDSFSERWLRDYPRPASTTHRTYGYAVKAFLKEFTGRRLHDIDRSERSARDRMRAAFTKPASIEEARIRKAQEA